MSFIDASKARKLGCFTRVSLRGPYLYPARLARTSSPYVYETHVRAALELVFITTR